MSEIIELYFEVAYRLIGKAIYGKNFSKQDGVPLYIKSSAALVAVLIFVSIIWLIIKISN